MGGLFKPSVPSLNRKEDLTILVRRVSRDEYRDCVNPFIKYKSVRFSIVDTFKKLIHLELLLEIITVYLVLCVSPLRASRSNPSPTRSAASSS